MTPPEPDPIERTWKVMHRRAAQIRHCRNFRQSAEATFGFFDKTMEDSGKAMIDTTADNFRVIGHDDYHFVG